jgi:hypothetical protein
MTPQATAAQVLGVVLGTIGLMHQAIRPCQIRRSGTWQERHVMPRLRPLTSTRLATAFSKPVLTLYTPPYITQPGQCVYARSDQRGARGEVGPGIRNKVYSAFLGTDETSF